MVKERISLAGEWIGHYPGHFDEVIRIEQEGDKVEAVKVTGDDYVPAGATTWRASLRTSGAKARLPKKSSFALDSSPGSSSLLIGNVSSFVGKTAARSSFAEMSSDPHLGH